MRADAEPVERVAGDDEADADAGGRTGRLWVKYTGIEAPACRPLCLCLPGCVSGPMWQSKMMEMVSTEVSETGYRATRVASGL